MGCRKGVWKVSKRSKPNGPPCTDDPSLSANGTCAADRGHCQQYTNAGVDMDRVCPETCESCDACRCQDDSQWHTYCPFWAQYCSSSGVLGTWMTSNCRKTCGQCRCKCCSYGGKQHQLGARIRLPEKCGELICEEGLVADYSPLLKGAAGHKVSHPEELTLNFWSVHDGADCCILPGSARNADGSSFPNGTMVEEGWSGELVTRQGSVSATCCHGILSVPLEEAIVKSTTSIPTTTRMSPRNNDDQCNQPYKILNDAWRKIKYNPSGASPCHEQCERNLLTGWYRFKEPAGLKLPITPPASFGTDCDVCQTDASAWIKEKKDPILGEGVIDINICFAWGNNECSYENQAKAVACTDTFGSTYYLYHLKPSSSCSYGYCALGA